MSYRLALFLSLSLLIPVAGADVVATTDDGRRVLLRDNGTWVIASESTEETEKLARLTLEKRFDLAHGCRLGLRLQNDLPAQIRSLVLRFTAYKGGQVPFETVSRGYAYLKPTTSQYQEIDFRGVTCSEISSVEVFAARNCHVGDLTKYSASAKACLKLFSVAPSDIMAIAKRVSN